MVLMAGLAVFQSCEPEIELPVLTDDEYPRIIGQWPEKSGNQLGMTQGYTDVEFTHYVQFTPSNLCKGQWYLNGVEYAQGTTFKFTPETAGEYNIKLIVSTSKYQTSREMILFVKESQQN
jgi:hypothetical protein